MRHWWLPFMLLAGALHAQSAPETGRWRGSARNKIFHGEILCGGGGNGAEVAAVAAPRGEEG